MPWLNLSQQSGFPITWLLVLHLFWLTDGNQSKEEMDRNMSSVLRSIAQVRSREVHLLPASNLPPIIVSDRNPVNGTISNVYGFLPEICDLIAHRFGFRYSWVSVSQMARIDNVPNQRGLVSYIERGEGDVIVGALVRTMERFHYVDFTMPVFDGSWGIMIPYPVASKINNKAMVEPFRLEVWVGLLISMVLVVMTMQISMFLMDKLTSKIKDRISISDKPNGSRSVFWAFEYMFTVLLSQGNYCPKQQHSIRLAAGTWCLAAFVLVQAYSGILTSFILSPNRNPIITSIYDIPNVPGLKVAVERGMGADVELTKFNDTSSSFGKLVSTFTKTMYRCNKTEECLEKVLHGRYVYVHGAATLDNSIIEDRKRTGQCQFSRAQQSFWYGLYSMGAPKKSPYFEIFNTGSMELDAAGFLKHLQDIYFLKPVECLRVSRVVDKKQRLSLHEFQSLFLMYAVGLCAALVAFLCERISYYILKRKPWLVN